MILGVCGSGTMGRGIVIAAAQAGIPCIVYEPIPEFNEKSRAFLNDHFRKAIEKKKMIEQDALEAMERITFAAELSAMSICTIVVEAIIEDPQTKVELFQSLEIICSDDCILATNTSSISIASLARHLKRPEMFVGLHFFNPAHIMKLVEVIRGPRTAEHVIQRATQLAQTMGKSPAIARDVPGFIVNRVARNYYNESQRIVTEGGAGIEQVDTIMKAAGFKMGPFELMDLIGVDVNLSVTKSMYEQYFYEPRFQPSGLQQYYVDAGLHGRKTGRGFYDYSTES